MPLSATEVADRLWKGDNQLGANNICVVPVPNEQLIRKKNAAAIDLRLGRWFQTLRQTKLTVLEPLKKSDRDDPAEHRKQLGVSREYYIRFDSSFVLHPGQFVIGITLEWLKFPSNLTGYVSGKSSWGRRGLIIETAAGIHPGFTGCLTLELANVGTTPIRLIPGMEICQIFFHSVNNVGDATTTQFVGYRKPILGTVEQDAVSEALSKQYF